MYIKRIAIKNVRSIRELTWELSEENPPAGWHVILGDNGSGKSTLLRAVALALVGPEQASALRQDWGEWLTHGQSEGSIRMDVEYDPDVDQFAGPRKLSNRSLLKVGLDFEGQNRVRLKKSAVDSDPEDHIWGGQGGWFSAAYGPFRRFTGGDESYEKLFFSYPRLAAHLSIFGENVALTESLKWLKELQFKQLEKRREGRLIEFIKKFVNQEDFLPNQVRLEEVSSKGVEFIDGNGYRLPVDSLSDGYRSILSLTFELIRQLATAYGEENIFDKSMTRVNVPGVVLIDEIDAHLHPSWQKRVGVWFCNYFPKIQFIVTTHSPLICQAAENGTVFGLPQPGSDEEARLIDGDALKRLLYGNVLEAYGTQLFGENITRSDAARKQLRRLAELNRKELHQKLSPKEQEEQQSLRATFPTTASTTSVDGESK